MTRIVCSRIRLCPSMVIADIAFLVWFIPLFLKNLFFYLYYNSGRDRFIENLSNLGSFITNYDAKMLKYDVEKDGKEIVTKVSLY